MAQNDKNLANLDLDGLRQEIDSIDELMQSLIIRRTKVVQAVGAYKERMIAQGSKVKVPYRPAREARIMRTLVARHEGAFPKTALIQIWREMIAAGTRLEAPYTVALCRNADGVDCWELARLNFGCLNEIIEFESAGAALHALEQGTVAVGVFPKPKLGEEAPWWVLLRNESDVKVVSKLPFGGHPVGRGETTRGFVLAPIDLEESGDDRSLFILELPESISNATASAKIEAAISGADLLGIHHAAGENRKCFLLDLPGYWVHRQKEVHDALIAHDLVPEFARLVGVYAVPVSEVDLK